VNYSSGYSDTSFTPNRDIDSYVTLDLNSSYQFGGNSSLRVVNQVSGYDGQQSVAVWQAVLDWYHQELIEDIGSSAHCAIALRRTWPARSSCRETRLRSWQ